ncbi:hypothetical protein HALLA_03225 (plasmid) [Halostagnicola larsenii XH-48]|uniref:Uncharacterized protein n=1 Tax=Halostagnicola larsenii XH-48 TaxID=797299 RepID=W0JVR1_9EURY|nr:hypothetical protein HALLA_03225 [Halostagnicola larsenii XH-48]
MSLPVTATLSLFSRERPYWIRGGRHLVHRFETHGSSQCVS